MEIKIFGYNMRLEVIVICILIGMFLGGNTFCSCAGGNLSSLRGIREGFNAGVSIAGAVLDYSMGNGVSDSFDTPDNFNSTADSWYDSLENNVQGLSVPLQEGELDIFSTNKMDPDCCPSTYSGSTGCVCATPEQMKYLNQRGGNRTLTSTY